MGENEYFDKCKKIEELSVIIYNYYEKNLCDVLNK